MKVTVIQNHRSIRVPPILLTHDEILIQTKSDFWRERRRREGRVWRKGREEKGKGGERRWREGGREEEGGGRREEGGGEGGREEDVNIPADPARKLFI